METNCKDCNRLIDECTCLADTVDFPKYTRDQKRRAVQECVKRLSDFEATLRLIRQFDIVEQDVIEYTAARYVNGSKYRISSDPALTTSSAYDPHTGRPIGAWDVEARVKSYKDWVTIEELDARNNQAALTRALQGLVTTPSGSLKSYTDWA